MLSLIRLFQIVYAKITGKKIGLCDIADVDGVVSATLFKRKYPNSVIVLAAPPNVNRGRLLRLFTWDYVADLPCPGKAKLRADHHKTNIPCAEREFYDPNAPCAALLAAKALDLMNDEVASKLVKFAIESDTARIESKETELLDSAVKGSGYFGKQYLISNLSRTGIDALKDKRIVNYIRRGEEKKEKTIDFLSKIKANRITIVIFKRNFHVFYRLLSIILERKGAEFTLLIVPRGLRTLRIYVGAKPGSKYDSSILARKFGGGGHQFAAGASIKSFRKGKVISKIIKETKKFLGVNKIDAQLIRENRVIDLTL